MPSPPSFTPPLLSYLSELADNNERDWFNANKARYEGLLKEPALRFIADFEPHLREISPHFQAIAKAQGGSLFRIYRDTRFGHDKRPYKSHVGVHFRHETGGDAHAPGFYLHIEPGASMLGMGVWMAEPAGLRGVRDHIVAEPARWGELRDGLLGDGFSLYQGEGDLKRVPAGYPADHPHAGDLKRKSHAAMFKLTDAEVVGPGLLERCADLYGRGAPWMAFLCEAVGVAF